MKIIYSFLLALLVCLNVNAQSAINITNEDMPVAGQIKYIFHDTTAVYDSVIYAEAAKNGINQNWNFSSLQMHLTDTVEYVDATTTANADSFPNAGVCGISSMYNTEVYFNKMNNGLFIDGFVSSSKSLVLNYDNPQLLLNYPSTYLDTFNSTSSILYQELYNKTVKINGIKYLADSVKKIVSYNTISNFDGYGSVTTPIGTFNALRQYCTKNTSRETYYHIPGQGWTLYKTKLLTAYKIRWWANGYCYPVVECSYYPNSGVVTSFSFAQKNDDVVLTKINNTVSNNNFIVYPNPAQSYIAFSNLNENAVVCVYNGSGILVLKSQLSALNKTIDIKDLSNGMYLYSIVKTTGETINTGKFNVMH